MPATLSLLRIKNLALVEDLEWQLGPGFTAITGETGAGKSIIIGALQLLLGERDRQIADPHRRRRRAPSKRSLREIELKQLTRFSTTLASKSMKAN